MKDEARVELEETEGVDVDYHSRIRIILNEERMISQEKVKETEREKNKQKERRRERKRGREEEEEEDKKKEEEI